MVGAVGQCGVLSFEAAVVAPIKSLCALSDVFVSAGAPLCWWHNVLLFVEGLFLSSSPEFSNQLLGLLLCTSVRVVGCVSDPIVCLSVSKTPYPSIYMYIHV